MPPRPPSQPHGHPARALRGTALRGPVLRGTALPRPALLGLTLLCLIALAATTGCRSPQVADERPMVVATTTMLADLARQLGGDDVAVYSIVSPGGDPHLYQPTPRDARQLSRSQLVITSGMGLEGWIDDLVRHAGGQRPIVVASTGVTAIGDPGGDGVDPHFWFDLRAWGTATEHVAAALAALLEEAGDPQARARLEHRVAGYRAANDALHDWTAEAIASIPEARRVLVTSHDAFSYFGRAYGIEVLSLIGTSTDQEAGQRDVANLISTVRARGIPAVFVESSVNPRTLEQVARETGARRAGPLYSDSVGPAGSDAASFHGMVRANVTQIVTELGGALPPAP